jgi:predicted SAM-dependent methyltransferase
VTQEFPVRQFRSHRPVSGEPAQDPGKVQQLSGQRCVLNVGSGPRSIVNIHPCFRSENWREVRVDVDPRVKPDIVASATNLSQLGNGSIDAIWSSHQVEHLERFEIKACFDEFRRVLKPDGFVLIATPDITQIAELILKGRLNDTVYTSPSGPITPLDMIFGHGVSIALGNRFMAHKTAHTEESLGDALLASDFAEVRTFKGTGYDIWCLALADKARASAIVEELAALNLNFRT